jgi:hypothetical protein
MKPVSKHIRKEMKMPDPGDKHTKIRSNVSG